MKFLFLNWRDEKNPRTGGAERVTHEVAEYLVQQGHEVDLFTARFPGGEKREVIHNVHIIRKGNRLSVYLFAFLFTIKNQKKYDIVLEFVNTIPFFTPMSVPRKKRFVLVHQLCKEIWFIEMKKPLSSIGYFLEKIFFLFYKNSIIYVPGESTKRSLHEYGVPLHHIRIFPEGIHQPEKQEEQKYEQLTMLYVGRLHPSKRIEDIIQSYEIVAQTVKDAQLHIVGVGEEKYEAFLREMAYRNYNEKQIVFRGRLPIAEKNREMQKSHFLYLTSVREGWGLVLTEANSLGTPSIVYNRPGIVDAVSHGENGYICSSNTPEEIAALTIKAWQNQTEYEQLVNGSICWANRFSWIHTGRFFEQELINQENGTI